MRSRYLDPALFAVVASTMLLILVVFVWNLLSQYSNYMDAADSAFSSGNHAAALSYSRAFDFVAFKTSALLASFLVIMVGALYVLRVERYQTSLSGGTESLKGSFTTSSPGLTMMCLGVVLAIASLYYRSSIEYRTTSSSAPEITRPTPQRQLGGYIEPEEREE